jgi:hypothetical protein
VPTSRTSEGLRSKSPEFHLQNQYLIETLTKFGQGLKTQMVRGMVHIWDRACRARTMGFYTPFFDSIDPTPTSRALLFCNALAIASGTGKPLPGITLP